MCCYRCAMTNAAHRDRPLEVLIVEDNRDARTVLRMMLARGYGYVVHEAADGESAVRFALERRPDVALVDIGLPDIDGYAVARRIRAALDGDAMLLIALTGYGTPEDVALALESGFDMHLVKPVDTRALAGIFDGLSRPGR